MIYEQKSSESPNKLIHASWTHPERRSGQAQERIFYENVAILEVAIIVASITQIIQLQNALPQSSSWDFLKYPFPFSPKRVMV